jgi:UDP-2,4-diacetamido-2,4,6-trideoxy-beta-L-altropyranose hydrolase
MVIDDLADRKHQCNLLLDQTFGRLSSDYEGLVPENCQLLLGSQYALLRPEFSQWREYSLKRRDKFEFKTLLISMGGVDKDNITTQILEQLQNCELPQQLKIIVVMGAGAPNLSIVQEMAKSLSYQVEVKVNVENMAELMSNSDLAIGASGATTWERCCLGLPSIQLIMAENQKVAASLLDAAGAIKLVNSICQLSYSLLNIQAWPTRISDVSRAICDGAGAQAVVDNLVRRN